MYKKMRKKKIKIFSSHRLPTRNMRNNERRCVYMAAKKKAVKKTKKAAKKTAKKKGGKKR